MMEVDHDLPDAVAGEDPAALEEAVRERFEAADEGEQAARAAVQKLEIATIRRILELQRGR